MGNYALSDFKAQLKLRLGNRDDLASPIDYLTTFVNQAYIDLATKNKFWGLRKNFRFPELETSSPLTTTAHVAYIAGPSDMLYPISVWDSTQDKRLPRISWSNYLSRSGRATTSSEGAPSYWTRYGDSIYFYATPDTTYTENLYYRKIPAVLSNTTDKTVLDAAWDEIILDLATIKGFESIQEFDKVGSWEKILTDKLPDRIGIYDKEDLSRQDIFTPSIIYINNEY
jgi:hypothetical protein